MTNRITEGEQWHIAYDSYDRVGNVKPYICRCRDGQHGRFNAVSIESAVADHNALRDAREALAECTTLLMGMKARLEARQVEGQTLAWSLSGGDWDTYEVITPVLARLAALHPPAAGGQA